jgi:hypothetical protein
MVFINHKMDLKVAFFFDSQKGGFLNRIFCVQVPTAVSANSVAITNVVPVSSLENFAR